MEYSFLMRLWTGYIIGSNQDSKPRHVTYKVRNIEDDEEGRTIRASECETNKRAFEQCLQQYKLPTLCNTAFSLMSLKCGDNT